MLAIHVICRTPSPGAAGCGEVDESSRRQQHARSPSDDLQQHRAEAAQRIPGGSLLEILENLDSWHVAGVRGANPARKIAANTTRGTATLELWRRQNMAWFQGQSICIVRGDAPVVQPVSQ